MGPILSPFDPRNNPPGTTGPPAPIPSPPVFHPSFYSGVTIRGPNGDAWPLNSHYFATPQTAQQMSDRCQSFFEGPIGIEVEERAFSVGFYNSSHKMQVLAFTVNGREFDVNAGYLAAHYVRNPEDQFPNVADNAVRNILRAILPA